MKIFSTIFVWLAFACLTVLYASATLNAYGNFFGVLYMAKAMSGKLLPWAEPTLIAQIALPAIVYAVALFAGRKNWFSRLILLAVGITVVAVVHLNLYHLLPYTALLQK